MICLISGCGGQPEFSHSEKFQTLKPYAQIYVDQVLDNYFGSPSDMVAWDKLPLELHYGQGTVVEASGRMLTVELQAPHAEITAGTEVLWDSGILNDKDSAWILEWDEAKHQAKLESPLATNPEVGDAVILGPGQILATGRMLYAEHCQHCHGVAGDGNGPTAPYLNPRPRDYRKGIFKFTTTQSSKRASREDLSRIVEDGIPGTYMPSFKLLTEDEMTSIIEYVMWLSMRGELENQLIGLLADSYSVEAVEDRIAGGDETYDTIHQEFIDAVNDPDSFPFEVDTIVSRFTSEWVSSQEPDAEVQPLTPRTPSSDESIAKGRELYLKPSLKCAQCHGEAGLGDGSQTFAVSKDAAGQDNLTPGLYDTWGNLVKPRNLHSGIYRGGRRPIDLYSRIYAGIKGTPMPAFSSTLLRKSNPEDSGSEMTDEDIWHLVNYIYSIPFEDVKAGQGGSSIANPVKDANTASEEDSEEVAVN